MIKILCIYLYELVPELTGPLGFSKKDILRTDHYYRLAYHVGI
jgi:hypothetical protein